MRVCRKCRKRTAQFYVSRGRVVHPCKACRLDDNRTHRRKLRRAVNDTRAEHATLTLVNPSLTSYRERWMYAWGWVKLCEWPV